MKPRHTGRHLAFGFLIVSVLPLAGLSWFNLLSFEHALTRIVLQSITRIGDKKADQIDVYINERLADAESLARQEGIRTNLEDLISAHQTGTHPLDPEVVAGLRTRFGGLGESKHYHDILLIDPAGNVLFSLREESDLGTNLMTGPYRDSMLAIGFDKAMAFLQTDLTPFAPYAPSGEETAAFVVAPLFLERRPIGAIALQVNLAALMPVVADRTGLGLTGETVMAMREAEQTRYTIELERLPGAAFTRLVPFEQTAQPMRAALSGQHGSGIVADYSGVTVAADWRYLPALQWGMVVKIDVEEALAPLYQAQRTTLLTFVVLALLAALAADFLGRRFVRAESALEQSLTRLREAQRIARLGHWSLDLRANRLDWSEEVFQIFEIDPRRFAASYQAFLEAVHPDDRARVDQAYRDSLASGQPYSIQHRLRCDDGRIKYLQEHGQSDYAPDGTPLRSYGTVQDISELHRAMETLQLYANMFEHSGEAILVTDADQRIVAINPAFTRQTGYTLAEIQGQTPSMLSSERTAPTTYQALWEALDESGYWQGELWDHDRDGNETPKWAAISTIRNRDGDITHYIASFTDISERKAAEQRIEHLAHHDSLTGLFNRYNLQIRLSQAIMSAHQDGHHLAVLLIDLDHFKVINDTLGHQVGDLLLIEVAKRLRAAVRESDIVARQGGDEFVVVLTGLHFPNEASPLASKILTLLATSYEINGQRLHSSPSIGISVYPGDGADAGVLMRNADAAMYHAKELGRHNAQFFTEELNVAAAERLRLECELRIAIDEHQFELHYQPQIKPHQAPNSPPEAMEALIRWRHPERGLIPPIHFIPIAEQTGLIQIIGQWVIEEACQCFARWKAHGVGPKRMAVNLSASQLSDPTLVEKVAEILHRHGLGEDELELEITESTAMDRPELAIVKLQSLRDLGVSLAIDDFGTGYSSLAYLKRLPIMVLKLDREFVRDIEFDDNDAAISVATIALAHILGLRVVAEGIETEGQSRFLREHGCDLLQGYFIGKPASEAFWTATWSGQAPEPRHAARPEG
ncbi:diguanylate cyclase [Thiocapsa imhoffii]|uniref:Diguanylate cyclase n=1 Tax=Thiocapsa imhoffii TaxID=382777 RepID=A0A9X0WKQ3_9GAMM|nr:EAL domain-containing protein [Thiocapsa imhoffii]MBK1645922.1 diguanylate cyclase [Thiocapsa imhoffii]